MACMPIIVWQTCLGPIGLKLFVGTQETIIYRLVIRNHRYDPYDAYFSILMFLAGFHGKMGFSTIWVTKGLRSQKPSQTVDPLHWVDLFATVNLRYMFS